MPSNAEVQSRVDLPPGVERPDSAGEAEEAVVKGELSEVKSEPTEDSDEERDVADLGDQGHPPSPTSPALDGRAADGEAHPKRQRRLAEAEPDKKPAGATAEDDASEEEEEGKPEIEVQPPQFSVTEPPPPQPQRAPAPAAEEPQTPQAPVNEPATTEPGPPQRQPAPAPAAPEPQASQLPPSADGGPDFTRFFHPECGQCLDEKIKAQAKDLAGSGEELMTSTLLSMFKSPTTRNYTASEASTAASACDPEGSVIDSDMEDAAFYNDMRAKKFMFPARGEKGNPAGGRWQRYINGKSEESKADKVKYNKLQGQTTAQAKFRANWLKTVFKKKLEEKVHTKQFRKRTYKDGRYLCANRIIQEEGGGKQGAQNCANYCLKCLAIGAPWVTARESPPPSTLPPKGERVVWLP